MSLRVLNTMSRQKEAFTPSSGEVRMYVCGVTPYDAAHIGHARCYLVFDVVVRYLRYRGYRVRYVRNFTDVDDKIIARAAQRGESPRELADRHIDAYRRDMADLGIEAPILEPKATEHIAEMIELIERLLAGGFAYVVDGDVYFEVRRFPPYGRLSGRNLDELLAGARVDVDERKRDPRDFALWKTAKPGELSWESPWGAGRPGWHIECSAMALRHLGESTDLHGGGEDLMFPHHECEIAQSEAATGRPFARFWLHNGMVNLNAEKMSKSLGNVLTVRSLLERHDADAIRLYLLQTHYRRQVDFSEERLREQVKPLERLRELRRLVDQAAELSPTEAGSDPGLAEQISSTRADFEAAMDDDFNTPQALAAIFELSRALNAYHSRIRSGERPARPFTEGVAELEKLTSVLGFGPLGYESRRSGAPPAPWERLVQEREEARKARDWARADALRAELEAQGISVEDTPSGPRWKKRTGG